MRCGQKPMVVCYIFTDNFSLVDKLFMAEKKIKALVWNYSVKRDCSVPCTFSTYKKWLNFLPYWVLCFWKFQNFKNLCVSSVNKWNLISARTITSQERERFFTCNLAPLVNLLFLSQYTGINQVLFIIKFTSPWKEIGKDVTSEKKSFSILAGFLCCGPLPELYSRIPVRINLSGS